MFKYKVSDTSERIYMVPVEMVPHCVRFNDFYKQGKSNLTLCMEDEHDVCGLIETYLNNWFGSVEDINIKSIEYTFPEHLQQIYKNQDYELLLSVAMKYDDTSITEKLERIKKVITGMGKIRNTIHIYFNIPSLETKINMYIVYLVYLVDAHDMRYFKEVVKPRLFKN